MRQKKKGKGISTKGNGMCSCSQEKIKHGGMYGMEYNW